MISPVLIGGFAALDAALAAQVGYAVRDYQTRTKHRAARRARHGQQEHGGEEE